LPQGQRGKGVCQSTMSYVLLVGLLWGVCLAARKYTWTCSEPFCLGWPKYDLPET
jgi:hypothetical protein